MLPENALPALLMTTAAGLSTGIGSLIALLTKKTNTKFLSASLGFSAGVMIYVSMIELFPSANGIFNALHGERKGTGLTALAFFIGMFVIAVIERLLPDEQLGDKFKEGEKSNLYRTGLVTALALALHNFPEGLATFVSALQGAEVAVPIVFAIAIHNIPEGIAVSVPIYYATGSRMKAFVYSFLSGLTEPLAAVLGMLVLMPFLNEQVYAALNAAVAGIMVFISFDELIPAANRYGHQHLAIYGTVGGMVIMAISLIGFL